MLVNLVHNYLRIWRINCHLNNFKRLNYDLIHELSWDIKNANDFGKSIFKTSMLNGQIGLHKTHQITGKIINNYGENKTSVGDDGDAVKLIVAA